MTLARLVATCGAVRGATPHHVVRHAVPRCRTYPCFRHSACLRFR